MDNLKSPIFQKSWPPSMWIQFLENNQQVSLPGFSKTVAAFGKSYTNVPEQKDILR